MLLTNKRSYIASIFLIFLISIGGIYWWHKSASCSNHIYPYDAQKDRAFVLDLFQKDLYWLSATTNFSAEYMLDNRASSKDIEDIGKLFMYVYRDSQPRGFIAYYKKNLFLGFILFLVVPEEYRKKGYGKCLLEFAIQDLKHQGCVRVELITRVSNHPAQKTYHSLGFHEFWRDEEFVRFEKNLL